MVRVLWKHSMIGWLFLFVMTFCLISLSEAAYSADKAVAKLTSFSGTVLIKSRGDWGVKPEAGLPLYSDDKVVTKMGIATITFDDGAVIEIKANSNLLIRESEGSGISKQVGAAKRQLRLILGKILFRSGKGTSVNTSLETTTMVCGLRGTAGTLSIDASGQTYLQFTEGGGDTIGNFISGIATDVAPELANLNAVQRAGFVAAAAADQAKRTAEKLSNGEITNADAALASANAAEAAANEAYAAAEAMLTNPDEDIRNEARAAMAAAQEAINAAKEAQQRAIDAGATGSTPENASMDLIVTTGFDVQSRDFLKGKDDDAVLGDSYGVLGDSLTRMVFSPTPQGNENQILPVTDGTAPTFQVTYAPSGFNNSTNPVFELYANEYAVYYYSLDGGALTAIDTPTEEGMILLQLNGLADGSHTIDLIARDSYGNTSEPQTYTWVKDTMPPVVTLAMTPDGAGATTLTASTSNTELGTVSYQFINLANQTALPPTGLNTGVYQIGVIAEDQAGNISTTQTFAFALQNTTLSGNITGSGSTITGTASGASSMVLGQGLGGWTTSLSGRWSGTHTGPMSLTSGGTSQIGGSWISFSTGTINLTTGAAAGTTNYLMLDSTTLTQGSGSFTGIFNNDANKTWSGTETGSGLTSTPLTYSGMITSSSYYNYLREIGESTVFGNAGVAPNGNLFDGIILGNYANETGPGPYLNVATVMIYDPIEGQKPAAFAPTIWKNGMINGFLSSIYNDEDNTGRAGLFYESLTGNYYENVGVYYTGMWLAETSITPIEMVSGVGTNGITIEEPTTQEIQPIVFQTQVGGDISFDQNAIVGASAIIPIRVRNNGNLEMLYGSWGAGLIGAHTTVSDGWTLSLADNISANMLMEFGPGSDDGINTVNSTWASSTNEISAFAAGSWVDLTEAVTGVAGGKLIGTFDPNNWQAIAAGAVVDTRTFLAMADDPAGRAKLAQLDIPCVQVGVTDLTGSGGALLSVTMNDVKFFAYSTGAEPEIWATGDVNGVVSAVASPTGSTALLSGTGTAASINASFTMNQYSIGTGTWDAQILGSGIVNTHDVSIEGNAAGAIDTSTSFSGTASGVTRPVN